MNIGTHQTDFGLNVKLYYTDYFFQVNTSSSFYIYGHNLGQRRKMLETRNAVGLILMAGKKEMPIDFQLDGLNHQTAYNFAMGYNFIFYNDNKGTSQTSGGIALHLKHVSIYHENDVFAGGAKDRFRTAHLYLSYRNKEYKLGTGVRLWTGETAGAWRQNVDNEDMPNGCKILEDLPYGNTSHGIAYASFIYQLPYQQDIHLRLGADSEQIRHIVQNKMIHDLWILPGIRKLFKHTTPHYPRLDENGCPVFNKEDARKDKFYMQFGMNENWSN